jgi:hypothetical protein
MFLLSITIYDSWFLFNEASQPGGQAGGISHIRVCPPNAVSIIADSLGRFKHGSRRAHLVPYCPYRRESVDFSEYYQQ